MSSDAIADIVIVERENLSPGLSASQADAVYNNRSF